MTSPPLPPPPPPPPPPAGVAPSVPRSSLISVIHSHLNQLTNGDEFETASSRAAGMKGDASVNLTLRQASRPVEPIPLIPQTPPVINRTSALSQLPLPPSSVTAPLLTTESDPPNVTPPPILQPPTPEPMLPYPALHLVPLNDTFVPKQIGLLAGGGKVKIGRQTNAKTVPNSTNGYFDSKVLSRVHAEVWCEEDKVFIKDVKSSNGTFINGERLSPESTESDVFELHSEDIVEFGIDIVSDDNKTIVHHKVAAKVFIVMNQDDVAASARDFNKWYRNAGEIQARRASKANLMGSNGLSFDHVLNRLQGELQKSRDTGADLGHLSGTLEEVHDTLSGTTDASYPFAHLHPSRVPPFVPNGAKDHQAQSIAALQTQLNETQSSLATHVGRIKDLEARLAEQEGVKREVGSLREMMEDSRREMDLLLQGRNHSIARGGKSDGRESPVASMLEEEEEREEEEEEEAHDDENDDTRSVASNDTIVPAQQRPRMNGYSSLASPSSSTQPLPRKKSQHESKITAREAQQMRAQNAQLAARLEALATSLDESLALSASLRSQHSSASTTILALEARVIGLERAVEGKAGVEQQVEEKWNGWKAVVEEGWKRERQGWETERERLLDVVRDWEARANAESSGEGEEESETDEKREQGGEKDWIVAEADDDGSNAVNKTRARKSKVAASKRKRRLSSERIAPHSANSIASTSSSTSSPSHLSDRRVNGSGRWLTGERVNGRARGESIIVTSNNTLLMPLAGAGVVVLVGVIAAWALSNKVKD